MPIVIDWNTKLNNRSLATRPTVYVQNSFRGAITGKMDDFKESAKKGERIFVLQGVEGNGQVWIAFSEEDFLASYSGLEPKLVQYYQALKAKKNKDHKSWNEIKGGAFFLLFLDPEQDAPIETGPKNADERVLGFWAGKPNSAMFVPLFESEVELATVQPL